MGNPTQKRGFASDRGARQLTAAERAAMEGAAPEAAVTRDVAVGADGTPRVVPDPPRRQAGGGGGGSQVVMITPEYDGRQFLENTLDNNKAVASNTVRAANLLHAIHAAGLNIAHMPVAKEKPIIPFYGFRAKGEQEVLAAALADAADAAAIEPAMEIAAQKSLGVGRIPAGMTPGGVLQSIADTMYGGDKVALLRNIVANNNITQLSYAQTADMMAHGVNAIHERPDLQAKAGLYPMAAGGGAPPVPPAGGGGGGAGYWNEPSATFADLPVINDALADWKRRDLAIAGGLAAAGLGAGGLFLANYLGDRPAEIDPALAMAMAQSNQRGM